MILIKKCLVADKLIKPDRGARLGVARVSVALAGIVPDKFALVAMLSIARTGLASSGREPIWDTATDFPSRIS
jgi:hypothetical protein